MSGGCVEGAVYELAPAPVRDGGRRCLQRYGVSDDDAFTVGLTCGGIIDVFVEAISAGDASPSSARWPRRSWPANRSRWPRSPRAGRTSSAVTW